ncbi:MAG TPA: biotin/lipoyl-containing protein, partial [Puia sp.]
MAIVDVLMPKMGESIMEATILKWHKQPGDHINQDETLLDIATDKVDSEVPSTAAGILEETLFQVNDVVAVGAVIARIKTEMTEAAGHSNQPPAPEKPEPEKVYTPEDKPAGPDIDAGPAAPNGNGNRFYSPLVLNIAGSEGIPVAELEKIPGTGNEGRVTKKDILQYVSGRKTENVSYAAQDDGGSAFSRPAESKAASDYSSASTANTTDAREYNPGGNVEIREMDRMRKLIAEHMVRSKQTSPHVTSFSEADVTNLVLWREK